MGYKQELETKLIRKVHVVDFWEGEEAGHIQEDIKRVPPQAKLIEHDVEGTTIILRFEVLDVEGEEGKAIG